MSWRINHGTMDQCDTILKHIQAMNHLLWWEYAIEKKPDGLGEQYHLHMEMLFEKELLKSSLARNICRNGQAIGKSADPNAKITGRSTDLRFAFDEHWIEGYCHGKEGSFDECVKADVSGPFKEEWRKFFPTEEQQQKFQRIAHSADEQMETIAIEFENWCEEGDGVETPFNGDYLSYTEGRTNLEELVCAFLDVMMFERKRMKVLTEKRKLVNLKQMVESYVGARLGVSRTKYRKWFATQAEIEERPANIKKKMEQQAREDDILINSVLNS